MGDPFAFSVVLLKSTYSKNRQTQRKESVWGLEAPPPPFQNTPRGYRVCLCLFFLTRVAGRWMRVPSSSPVKEAVDGFAFGLNTANGALLPTASQLYMRSHVAGVAQWLQVRGIEHQTGGGLRLSRPSSTGEDVVHFSGKRFAPLVHAAHTQRADAQHLCAEFHPSGGVRSWRDSPRGDWRTLSYSCNRDVTERARERATWPHPRGFSM